MSDTNNKREEIVRLQGEIDRLKQERDEYRQELETLKAKTEETISAQLRLLSRDLSKEIQDDFFLKLQRFFWVAGILGLIVTAGGLWSFSDSIDRTIDDTVEDAVDKREKDILRLRETNFSAHFLQQRSKRRHVYEFHGLQQRRCEVNVH